MHVLKSRRDYNLFGGRELHSLISFTIYAVRHDECRDTCGSVKFAGYLRLKLPEPKFLCAVSEVARLEILGGADQS